LKGKHCVWLDGRWERIKFDAVQDNLTLIGTMLLFH
jgi:hypothetical protein